MKVSHLLWAGGFTGSDGRSYRESVDDAAEALATTAALDAKTLVVYSGPRAGHTHSHARRIFQSALVELAPQAAELGVTMAVEPMHAGCAAEWTFLTTIDDTLSLLDAVRNPCVKLVLDTYHLGQSGELAQRVAELARHVAIVQLGDARQPPRGEQNRCRLGEGLVPLKEIVAALKASAYDGYYDVELLGEEIETADYHSLLKHAKQAYHALVES
jgi:sugar phosphate isomerase/epimerase